MSVWYWEKGETNVCSLKDIVHSVDELLFVSTLPAMTSSGFNLDQIIFTSIKPTCSNISANTLLDLCWSNCQCWPNSTWGSILPLSAQAEVTNTSVLPHIRLTATRLCDSQASINLWSLLKKLKRAHSSPAEWVLSVKTTWPAALDGWQSKATLALYLITWKINTSPNMKSAQLQSRETDIWVQVVSLSPSVVLWTFLNFHYS